MRRRSGQKSRRAPKSAAGGPQSGLGERLQKYIAGAGVGSRRECEELILAGRVEVNRKVVTELGTRVNAEADEIRVDGELLKPRRPVYYAVYKPDGVVSTNRDPAGRPRVIDLLPKHERLFPVGRLDLHSEGLILVTNDGELANHLTHPRYHVPKRYQVLAAGRVEPELLERLRRGIHLAEGVARVAEARIKRHYKKATVLEMVLEEGRNREIRRVMARIGHKVLRLTRVGVGPIKLANLAPGEFRRLTPPEVNSLRQAAFRKEP